MLPAFSYTRPERLKDVIRELKTPKAYAYAGGTDLLGCLHDGIFSAEKLVSLSALQDLKSIRKTADGGLRIGSLTTVHALANEAAVRDHYPVLAQAAAEVASPQLRNHGTLGGNLCQKPRCWYYRGEFDCVRKGGATCYAFKGQNQYHCILGGSACYIVHPSDVAPALVALDAVAQIRGAQGERTLPVADLHVLPADDPFRETYLEPDEIITAVYIPAPAAGLRSRYRKVRARQSWDFAVAGLALALNMDQDRVADARVVLSGAAPVPWRSRDAEAVLKDQRLTAETAAQAAEAAMAKAKALEHNAYKVPMFKGLIQEELLKQMS
jgi:xanthine dehydrogenase YagS FAD-binding subunit